MVPESPNSGLARRQSDIGEVRLRLLRQGLAQPDVERELEISRLAAQIEFLGMCSTSRELCTRLTALVSARPPEFIEAMERHLGLIEPDELRP